MRRQLARPGLSYYDANEGRLVTETAELVDLKGRIRERWPSLNIYFDKHQNEFVVTQLSVVDGVERFVLSRPYCDDRILVDISKTDPDHRNYVDPEKSIDDHNASVERERDREIEEIAGDAGEKLIHALKKDGFYNHESIDLKPKPHLAQRSINAGRRP